MSDEVGRCFQGNDAHPDSGTDACFFINRDDVPKNKKPTYARIVAEDRPHKEIKKRIRLTVGGNRIEYPGAVSTKTSDLTPLTRHSRATRAVTESTVTEDTFLTGEADLDQENDCLPGVTLLVRGRDGRAEDDGRTGEPGREDTQEQQTRPKCPECTHS